MSDSNRTDSTDCRSGTGGSPEMRFRDTSAPVAERVRDLIGRLTLEEKTGLLMMGNPAIARLGIGAYHWWSEGLHGYARSGVATVFPQAIGLAASWSPELLQQVAEVTATEARAKYNEERAANAGNTRQNRGITIWSPNINIFRDPRWGRGQETYGEDPLLTARLAERFVRGLQGDHPRYLKTVATLKHFAVHSGPESLRHRFDAQTPERDLFDTYLPAFEEGVRCANARSVMSAYNGFNGTPCVASHWLLTDLLRDTWGFDGAVVGDVDNIVDLYKEQGHRTARDGAEAIAQALRAGNDLRSGWEAGHGIEALERGLVGEEVVDRALERLLRLRFELGQFDPPGDVPWDSLTPAVVESAGHVQLAYEACRQSLVLLKNDGVLPLRPERLRSIAVIGPTADDPDVLTGNYAGEPYRPVTLLAGLRSRLAPLGIEVLSELDIPFAEGHATRGQPVPPGVFFTDAAGTSRGLVCRMYDGSPAGDGPVVERVDAAPALEWNAALPRSTQLTAPRATVVWSGYMKLAHAGRYAFHTRVRGRASIQVGAAEPMQSYYRLKAGQDVHVRELPGEALVPLEITWEQDHDEGFLALDWTPADGGEALERAYARAEAVASRADVICLTLGLSHRLEGEEMSCSPVGFDRGDRTTIGLPAPQQRLLDRVAGLGKPVVLILSSGSAVAFDPAPVGAVLQTWYYGQQGGHAIADALLGVFSPAGRLPVTFYAGDSDLPPFTDYAMRGRTYRYFEGRPLYAFGHGLTYTSFAYCELAVRPHAEGLVATLTVENTGDCASDEVVQIYASRTDVRAGDPVRWLVGFERLRDVQPGEARTVTIVVPERWLALWDESARQRVVPKDGIAIAAGPASDNLPLAVRVDFGG